MPHLPSRAEGLRVPTLSPEPNLEPRSDRLAILGVLGLTAIGIALRAYAIGQGSFWVDEAYTARIAQLPALEIIKTTAGDVHPPLYYLLLRGWMLVFGDSEAALRSMSMVLDVAATAAIADLAWLLFRRRPVVLLAVALHVLSPFAILYAQEARMYSLMLLLSTLSASWLARTLRGGSWQACGLYVLWTTLVVYTHMFGFFMIAGQAVFVAAGALWTPLRMAGPGRFGALGSFKAAVVAAAVPLLTAPWAYVVRQQMKWAASESHKGVWWIPKPPLKGLVGPFYSFGGDSLVFMAVAVMLLAVVTSAALGLLRGRKWPWLGDQALEAVQPAAVLLLLLMTLSPILISFVMSHVTTPIYVSRFMMGGYGAFLVLLALGVALLPNRALQAAAALALLGLSVSRIPATNYDHSFKANSPWRELTRSLIENTASRSVLYQPDDEWPVDWYLRRRSTLSLARVEGRLDQPIAPVDGTAGVVLVSRRDKTPSTLMARGGSVTLERTEVVNFGNLAIANYAPRR